MSEFIVYENDKALPCHYDMPLGRSVPIAKLAELYHMIRAMRERDFAVLVTAMSDDECGDGDLLVFSTLPVKIPTTEDGR